MCPASLHSERAEAVLDVLDTAANALKRSDAEAVAATFDAVRQARAGPDGRLSDEAVRELELTLTCELAERMEAAADA